MHDQDVAFRIQLTPAVLADALRTVAMVDMSPVRQANKTANKHSKITLQGFERLLSQQMNPTARNFQNDMTEDVTSAKVTYGNTTREARQVRPLHPGAPFDTQKPGDTRSEHTKPHPTLENHPTNKTPGLHATSELAANSFDLKREKMSFMVSAKHACDSFID